MIYKYLKPLIKYRFVISLLVGAGLFGLLLYKFTLLSQPRTDTDYLKQQQSAEITEIKIDPSLREELEKLEDTKVDTQPDDLGQADPFNP